MGKFIFANIMAESRVEPGLNFRTTTFWQRNRFIKFWSRNPVVIISPAQEYGRTCQGVLSQWLAMPFGSNNPTAQAEYSTVAPGKAMLC